MSNAKGPQTHYVCHLYEERKAGKNSTVLAVKTALPFPDANQAISKAERAFSAGTCVGADAFSVNVDPDTDETDDPVFFVRLGKVPEFDPI